ncbi:MAG: alkaline phosphatase family protein [Gemmatimonadota bacterium]
MRRKPTAPATSPVTARGTSSPIEHIVVLMMENRSFDHIFGYRPGINGLTGTELNLLDPAKPESETNPSYMVNNGAPWAVLAGLGPGHSLNAANVQLCNNKVGPSPSSPGANNGFIANYQTELVYADKVKNPAPAVLQVAMQSFPPTSNPSINALADAFCICDHWFSEVPGPTQPNRLFLHAATSFGYALNVWTQKFDGLTIYNQLQDAGVTWATYQYDDNEVLEFTQVSKETANFKLYDPVFAADVKAGKLANYVFISPRFMAAKDGSMANSQHAPQDVRYGDNFIADVYETLRSNDALWNQTALVVIYDEHGGFYDHVVPPSTGVPNPDGINSPPAGNKLSYAPVFDFDRLGFRVPAVIASPWVKAGRVDSTQYQHTSVMATARAIFGVTSGPLTKRDASANTFNHLFAELTAPRTDTPATLPRAPLPVPPPLQSPAHPANQPLDPTQKDVLHRAFALTRASQPDTVDHDSLPETQGEASEFIRKSYVRHFGVKEKAGKPRKKTNGRR